MNLLNLDGVQVDIPLQSLTRQTIFQTDKLFHRRLYVQ